MTKLLREFRLIPVVLIAVVCLLVLKSIGIVFDGGYTLGNMTTVPASQSAQLRPQTTRPDVASSRPGGLARPSMTETSNYPDATGSVPSAPPKPKTEAKQDAKPGGSVPAPPDPNAGGTKVALDAPPRAVSAAERALLERLQERRRELDARARELDVRESMLAAAEKKLETKAGDPKTNDAKGGGAGQRKDDPDSRFKGVVTMYETMKPKDAAKIFDRLDIRVLLDVASQINPRVMSGILAQMSPETAERLTVELAARGTGSEKAINPNDLPKIEGKPTN